MNKLPIGNTGLSVTNLCFGTSGIGNMPDTYGYEGTGKMAVRSLLRNATHTPYTLVTAHK